MFSLPVLIGRGLDHKLSGSSSFDRYPDTKMYLTSILHSPDPSSSSPFFPLCSPEGAFSLNLSGGYNSEVTPVPIPNTAVKLTGADDTWLVTARKDRSPPDLYSSIAQLVEHAAVNRRVVGSSPT